MPASPGARRVVRRSWVTVAACAAAGLGVAAALIAMTHGQSPSPRVGAAGGLRTPSITDELGPDPREPGAAPTTDPGTGPPEVNVPVLLYHYVRVDGDACDTVGQGLSVTPTTFNAQMTMLQIAGFNVISLDTLMGAVLSHAPLPPHPVVLTFDDGYADFATAAVPILLAHATTATDFVVPGFLGHPRYMTAQQVVAVHSAGMTIAAHTLHHVALAHESPVAAAAEIGGSRLALEQLIGAPVPDFAYPYGDFNASVEHLVAAAGFREAFTTQLGIHQAAGYRFALPRLRVGDSVYYMASELGITASVAKAALAHPGRLPPGENPGSAPPPSACHAAGTTPTPTATRAPVTGARGANAPAAALVLSRPAVRRAPMFAGNSCAER